MQRSFIVPNPKIAYIESNRLWPDFHAKFLNYWQESIADSLLAHYEARIGEQINLTLEHVEIDEEIRTTHIEILRRQDKRLVTVLELLSPSNKEEPGWSRYLSKRSDLLVQPVHLVEIDLLLSGNRLPHKQSLPPGEYYCYVTRVEDRNHCAVTSWQGETRIPTVAIPLQAPDADLASSLQDVFEIAFSRGRYIPFPH
jgi:hypothetical protein